MVGVHVGVYLKYKSGKLILFGFYLTLYGLYRLGRRCYLHKAIEQLLDTKHIECRAEEYGC